MKLEEYMNVDKLIQHIDAGLVDFKVHPTLPLGLLCHTREALFNDTWDDVTTKCRGLIFDLDTNDIVARPFEKFFNINTENRPETCIGSLPVYNVKPIVAEKLDGSLGTLWRYKQHWGISSKGSFTSDHAQWATRWLEDHVEQHGTLVFPEGYTPVFEMICESVQTHVVRYYDSEKLVLIALVNNHTGEELSPNELVHYALTNKLSWSAFYPDLTISEALIEDRPNHEGYVFSYPQLGKTPIKVKIKHSTFLEHQKIVHKLTPKHVLELLKTQGYDKLCEYEKLVPQMIDKIKQWTKIYHDAYTEIFNACRVVVRAALLSCTLRKEFAAFFLRPENKRYSAVCFSILDQSDNYKQMIWKLIEREVVINELTEIEDE